MKISRIGTWVIGALFLSLALMAGNLKAASLETLSFSGGNPLNAGPSYTVGWDFTVNNPITITSLGWYQASPSSFDSPHDVGIFNATTQAELVTASVDGSGSLSANGFRYVSLTTPLTLSSGTYAIGGVTGTGGYYGDCSIVSPIQQITYNAGPAHTKSLSTQQFTLTVEQINRLHVG